MFNGRPFKLLAYQNAIWQDLQNQTPTLLYLDLYLDELHDKDDIVNGLAYNGEYNYTIQINASDMDLLIGSQGILTAIVTLNGQEVERNVVWQSSSSSVKINNQGEYQVTGNIGDNVIIGAVLQGNIAVMDTINIVIVENENIQPLIYLNPNFDKIRQYDTIDFSVDVIYGSTLIIPDNIQISLSANEIILSNQYLTILQSGSQYIIKANAIALDPQILYITVQNASPSFQTTEQFTLNVVSMFG